MFADLHIGRDWEGHAIEDACPCPKEPCGLVSPARAHPDCDEHPPVLLKSVRQGHVAADCPGARATPAPCGAFDEDDDGFDLCVFSIALAGRLVERRPTPDVAGDVRRTPDGSERNRTVPNGPEQSGWMRTAADE
jgi:hypothetical protein